MNHFFWVPSSARVTLRSLCRYTRPSFAVKDVDRPRVNRWACASDKLLLSFGGRPGGGHKCPKRPVMPNKRQIFYGRMDIYYGLYGGNGAGTISVIEARQCGARWVSKIEVRGSAIRWTQETKNEIEINRGVSTAPSPS